MTTTQRATQVMQAVRDHEATPWALWALSSAGIAFFGVMLYRQTDGSRWPYYGMALSALANPTLARAIGAGITSVAGPLLSAWRGYKGTRESTTEGERSGGDSSPSEPPSNGSAP